MKHLRAACLLLVAQAASLASGQFVNPFENGKSVWRVGEIQTVKFSTKITDYSIALWQELGGAAKLGPIIYTTSFGGVTQFDFLVRLDDINLDVSDKFFLWLKEGGQQGNQTAIGMSSAYFKITKAQLPVSSSSTSAATTTIPTPSPTTLSTATTAGSQTGGVTPPTQPSTTAAAPAPEGIVISSGALAGIGAAGGVVGLAAIIAIVWCCFRRRYRKREAELKAQQQDSWTSSYQGPPPPPFPMGSQFSPSVAHQQVYSPYHPGQDVKPALPRHPIEMPHGRTPEPVELHGGVVIASRRSFDGGSDGNAITATQ